ncbi:MAG: phage integrase SAM-like domain-containing protein, partial [Planctomycetaceae bacterium]
MASVHKDGKGWKVSYIDEDNARRSLRPGKVNKATANQIARHIDVLVAAKASGGTVELTTAKWLGDIGGKLHAKLVRAGLAQPKAVAASVSESEEQSITLADFLNDHIAHGRTSQGREAAKSTLANWAGTRRFLIKIFRTSKRLDEVTAEDAHQFRVWMDKRRIKRSAAHPNGKPMEENAKRKHIANCKMFFNAAKRRGLVETNPFDAQVSGTEANRSRDFYVTPKHTAILLNAAPDTQWCL